MDSLEGDMYLDNADGYYYLKQSGCISDPTIDDKQDFNNVLVRLYSAFVGTKL